MNYFIDSVLIPQFAIEKTSKFGSIRKDDSYPELPNRIIQVLLLLECPYLRAIAQAAIERRPWCRRIDSLTAISQSAGKLSLQFCDFENIEWEHVMEGSHLAASYLVRKGLSRKAQLALQIRRHLSKNPMSVLQTSFPYTIIVETWDAFDQMRLDFGGGTIASFDNSQGSFNIPLRQRLEWCIDDTRVAMESPERRSWHWILKPSVTNKGAEISMIKDWEHLLNILEKTSDIREWVLQRYIEQPLLVLERGHKFHLRVYVLCIGALKVFVFERILMLIAAHSYDLEDLDDIYRHLSNTARAAETAAEGDVAFDEATYVQLLSDLPRELMLRRPDIAPNESAALEAERLIRTRVREITGTLFAAFENEYTVFAPMSNCFELFGLDFMVDRDLGVHLLEANPGPDFKQTGGRLRRVIVDLFEQTCALVIDPQCRLPTPPEDDALPGVRGVVDLAEANEEDKEDAQGRCMKKAADFTLVYQKRLSVASLTGGMTFR